MIFCKLYANDNKLIAEIENVEDCIQLQEDIDELNKWSDKWFLDFNFEKSKIMTWVKIILILNTK